MLETTFTIASFLGSLAFSLSGFIIGVKKRLDVIGIFIIALITANGGGVIRDLLVGRTPVILQNSQAFYVVLFVMIIGMLLKLHEKNNIERKLIFVVSDSIGLVSFSLTGALVAIESNIGIWGVCTVAFITALGGGILRDVIVNETPVILKGGFYGTVAILQAIAIYLVHKTEFYNDYSILGIFILALALRMVAYFKNWSIPSIKLN